MRSDFVGAGAFVLPADLFSSRPGRADSLALAAARVHTSLREALALAGASRYARRANARCVLATLRAQRLQRPRWNQEQLETQAAPAPNRGGSLRLAEPASPRTALAPVSNPFWALFKN